MENTTNIAVIAAVSALGGVVISQTVSLLLSFLDRRNKRQVLLRQKYEEMATEFSLANMWIRQMQSPTSSEELLALSVSTHTIRVTILCNLYFRELEEPANRYQLSQLNFYYFVVDSYIQSSKATPFQQAIYKKEGKEMVEHMFDTRNDLLAAICKHSSRYTKA